MPREFMPAVPQEQVFMIVAKGKGMLPRIANKDKLICIKTTKLYPGDISILKNGDKYEVKYYHGMRGSPFYLNGKNEVFTKKNYRVIGKVSGIFTKLCI